MAKFCRNCGSPMSENALFCKVCGTQVKKSDNICAYCGSIMDSNAKFCKICGASRDQISQTENTQTYRQPSETQNSVKDVSAANQHEQAKAAPVNAAKTAGKASKGLSLGAKIGIGIAAAAVVAGTAIGISSLSGRKPSEPGNDTNSTYPAYSSQTTDVYYAGEGSSNQNLNNIGSLSGNEVGSNDAAGMTVEEAASEDIFYVVQTYTYASESFPAEYDASFSIIRINEKAGILANYKAIDDDEPLQVWSYNPETRSAVLNVTDEDDYGSAVLIHNPDGSFTGNMDGYEYGDEMHAYLEIKRITPTKDGKWLLLDSGEVFEDKYALANMRDSIAGQQFMESAAAYARSHGYSMREKSEEETSANVSTLVPNNQGSVSLGEQERQDLIAYYVMVEGQNRLREESGGVTSHIEPPYDVLQITQEEFEAMVNEYVANEKK